MFESFTLKPLICSNDASENLNSSVAFLWCQHWWRVWCLASLFLPPAIISKLQKVSDIKVLQEFQKIIKCPHVSATFTLRAILKKQHDTYHRPVETASLAHQMLCCQAFVTSAAGNPDSLTLYVVKSMESHRSVPEKSAKRFFWFQNLEQLGFFLNFPALCPVNDSKMRFHPFLPGRKGRPCLRIIAFLQISLGGSGSVRFWNRFKDYATVLSYSSLQDYPFSPTIMVQWKTTPNERKLLEIHPFFTEPWLRDCPLDDKKTILRCGKPKVARPHECQALRGGFWGKVEMLACFTCRNDDYPLVLKSHFFFRFYYDIISLQHFLLHISWCLHDLFSSFV